MFEDLVYLARLQAREDFIKEASRASSVVRALTTPFRNIKEGIKDYRGISNTIASEKDTIAKQLSSQLPNLTNDQLKPLASKAWKQNQKALIKSAPDEIEDATAHHDAIKNLSLIKLREARGRVLGGTAQLGVAGLVGKKLLGKGDGASAPPETT